MDRVLLAFWAVTLAAYAVLGLVKPETAREGLSASGEMLLQALPWMIISMLGAGLIAQFFQPELVAKWLGKESGIVGITIGALVGLSGTGSRWAAYPLAASMIAADAGLGAIFAFMTSWQLISLPRLPAEVPFLGLNFTIVRAIVSFIVAIAGGVLVELIRKFL